MERTYKIRIRHRDLGFLERVYDPVKERTLEFRFGAAASLVVAMPGIEAAGLGESVQLHLMRQMNRSGISLSGNGVTATEDRFGFEIEITAKVARAKWRIYEVPVSYYGRSYEEGKKITWRDGVRAMWCILKYSFA